MSAWTSFRAWVVRNKWWLLALLITEAVLITLVWLFPPGPGDLTPFMAPPAPVSVVFAPVLITLSLLFLVLYVVAGRLLQEEVRER